MVHFMFCTCVNLAPHLTIRVALGSHGYSFWKLVKSTGGAAEAKGMEQLTNAATRSHNPAGQVELLQDAEAACHRWSRLQWPALRALLFRV